MARSYRVAFDLSAQQARFLRKLARADGFRSLDAWFLDQAASTISDTLLDPDVCLENGILLADWESLARTLDPDDLYWVVAYWSGDHPVHADLAGRDLVPAGLLQFRGGSGGTPVETEGA